MSQSNADSDALSKSTYIGNYEVIKTIGEGAFAKVKLAVHRLTNMEVAIKSIDKSLLPDGFPLKNLNREADIMKTIDHANIIQLFEIIETKKNLYLVLEYASGGELLDSVMANGKISEKEASKFVEEIVSALEYLHMNNIVHRDLKAENLLLDSENHIKLSDFGLSNNYDPAKSLSTACGSPVYSAPELIEGKKYTGPEVDMWALGVNLFSMVTGELPFKDNKLPELYESIIKGKYQLPAYLSGECKDIISKLLVVNPKKRSTSTQIKEHPWISQGVSFLDPFGEEETMSLVHPKKLSDLDQEIMEELEQMGFDRLPTEQSILMGKFDQAAGTYHLLAFQKRKDAKIFAKENEKRANEREKKLADDEYKSLHADIKPEKSDSSNDLTKILFQVEREKKAKLAQERQDKKHSGTQSKTSAKAIEHKPHDKEAKALKFKEISRAHTTKSISPSMEVHSEKVVHSVKSVAEREFSEKSPEPVKLPGKTKVISIDETLYSKDDTKSTHGALGSPRTIKYASNCVGSTNLSPDELFAKVREFFKKNQVEWFNNSYLCQCSLKSVSFEIEICKIPNMMLHGLRMKKLTGDIWEFKDICAKVCEDLEIA